MPTPTSESSPRVWPRYLLFQLPGWLLAAAVLLGAYRWRFLPAWLAASLFVLWLLKDAAIFPLVRRAYVARVPTGAERLVGAHAIAQGRLAPTGYVRLGSELWRARAEPATEPIAAGSSVKVRGADGLTLIVESCARGADTSA